MPRKSYSTKLPKTPELDKLANCREESQAIGRFLDWLSEQNIFLARSADDEGENFVAISKSVNALLAEYFGIDEKKCEQERQLLLAELRKHP